MSVVLDASAVLALLQAEAGSERVAAAIGDARLPVVNLAEVLAKHVDAGADPQPVPGELRALGCELVAVTERDAELQAVVRAAEHASGRPGRLSLADRCCLAVGLRLGLPVMTADRAWADLDLGVDVEVIR
ncbi:PIN domain-containing protein [Nitriliruptor alkaliphilus]|uniref:PIN domain-containing protein n=1 Tax=Nitriliruptor alkaliphilus TaxID=427918 RepID=UPI0006964AA1|nr:type II toxin-antitoxin system VapC family toxin [Nitriliruptor alkaliphilus]